MGEGEACRYGAAAQLAGPMPLAAGPGKDQRNGGGKGNGGGNGRGRESPEIPPGKACDHGQGKGKGKGRGEEKGKGLAAEPPCPTPRSETALERYEEQPDLADQYDSRIVNGTRVTTPKSGWEGNIMAEFGGIFEKHNIQLVRLHYYWATLYPEWVQGCVSYELYQWLGQWAPGMNIMSQC